MKTLIIIISLIASVTVFSQENKCGCWLEIAIYTCGDTFEQDVKIHAIPDSDFNTELVINKLIKESVVNINISAYKAKNSTKNKDEYLHGLVDYINSLRKRRADCVHTFTKAIV